MATTKAKPAPFALNVLSSELSVPSASPLATNPTAAPNDSASPAATYETLSHVPSMEGFCRNVASLRNALATADAAVLAAVCSAVSADDMRWLHVMQRGFNDCTDRATHAALTEIVCALVQTADAKLYKTLLFGKFSAILTVQSDVDHARVAHAVCKVVRDRADLGTFLLRQQGTVHLKAFSTFARPQHTATIILHAMALDSAIVTELTKLKLDEQIGKLAISLVKSKRDDHETRDDIVACMKIVHRFVPTHIAAAGFGFLQMAVVLASTQVAKHFDAMADIACDICKGLTTANLAVPFASVSKFLPSLFVCAPYVARKSPRFLDILHYFATSVAPPLLASKDDRQLAQLYACCIHLLRPPFDKSVRPFMTIVTALHQVVGTKKISGMIRAAQFRNLRKMIDTIPDARDQIATRLVFERMVFQMAKEFPCAMFTGIFVPLASRVARGELSATDHYPIISGVAAFDEKKAKTIDENIEQGIATCRAQLSAVEADAESRAELVAIEMWQQKEMLFDRFERMRGEIATSRAEFRFREFVLPVRELLKRRKHWDLNNMDHVCIEDSTIIASGSPMAKADDGHVLPASLVTGSALAVSGVSATAASSATAGSGLSWQMQQRLVLSSAWMNFSAAEETAGLYKLYEVEGEEEATRGVGVHFVLPKSAGQMPVDLTFNFMDDTATLNSVGSPDGRRQSRSVDFERDGDVPNSIMVQEYKARCELYKRWKHIVEAQTMKDARNATSQAIAQRWGIKYLAARRAEQQNQVLQEYLHRRLVIAEELTREALIMGEVWGTHLFWLARAAAYRLNGLRELTTPSPGAYLDPMISLTADGSTQNAATSTAGGTKSSDAAVPAGDGSAAGSVVAPPAGGGSSVVASAELKAATHAMAMQAESRSKDATRITCLSFFESFCRVDVDRSFLNDRRRMGEMVRLHYQETVARSSIMGENRRGKVAIGFEFAVALRRRLEADAIHAQYDTMDAVDVIIEEARCREAIVATVRAFGQSVAQEASESPPAMRLTQRLMAMDDTTIAAAAVVAFDEQAGSSGQRPTSNEPDDLSLVRVDRGYSAQPLQSHSSMGRIVVRRSSSSSM